MMERDYPSFINQISKFIPKKNIYTDELRRLAWGTDAGFYRLIPQVVVRVDNEAQVSQLLTVATSLNIPVTFRAAGTSLSGQTITDSVLVVATNGWEGYEVIDDARGCRPDGRGRTIDTVDGDCDSQRATAIRLQPGIIGARVNAILAPYGRMFAPDPASKGSAMVGGIVMNNASGMNCGTHANSDRILRSIRIVLADGTVIDTSRPSDNPRETRLLQELASIRDEILADAALTERIRRKYSIKNVTGLNLRPFVAYSDPRDILAHVMVGSEGTLAFMSEVTVNTSPLLPLTASAMAYFADMHEACRAVVALKKGNPEVYSCELLDKKSLASVNDTTGDGLTALLIETRAETPEQLHANMASIESRLNEYELYRPVHFTDDAAECAALWRMRSGVFPAVGGTRPVGTTALIEDIAFHIDDLPEATVKLAELIAECGYDDSCIYGHAFEGNYHFVISQGFDSDADVEKYKHLIDRIVELVVDEYDGSLKAEHGTGRNMAPFVEKEWGEKAFGLMKRIKNAFDPQGLLNPGVIFNDDPRCYISHFKPLPQVDPAVDKCIECGFCEVNCVSCGLTLSARQRIVSQREIASLKATGRDPQRLATLEHEYVYPGLETCAADGLCSMSCPMGINTGNMTHRLRAERTPAGSTAYRAGKWAADHLAGIESALRPLLGAAHIAHKVLGDKGVDILGKGLHYLGAPLWTPSLPKPFNPKKTKGQKQEIKTAEPERRVVYFPSCINQTMGASGDLAPLTETMVRLCNKAGYEVIFPADMAGLCCGMIWESKGMPDIADAKTAQLEQALLKASEGGRYPVLCDQSPCLHRMRQHISSMKLYEPAEFITEHLAQHLDFHPTDRPVAVHVTCSTRLMGLADTIVSLARRCSTQVLVPDEVGCCGFAGDKGFTHPELNAWGLRKLRPQIVEYGAREGYSNSRTCEIGLTTNAGIPYQSIVYLVDEVTTVK